jgi:hypothetical protein
MRELKCPFGCLFTKISDDNRLLCTELDWTCAKIENVRKINHGSFSDCVNWHNEFGFHACSDFGSSLIFVVGLGVVGEQNLKQF